uniref:Uncharacterized protein n=1 Tax=Arundo donax TaxID=35708 RepID=A0A0A9DMJ2_ARUDO
MAACSVPPGTKPPLQFLSAACCYGSRSDMLHHRKLLRINKINCACRDPDLIQPDLAEFEQIGLRSGSKIPPFLRIHAEFNKNSSGKGREEK